MRHHLTTAASLAVICSLTAGSALGAFGVTNPGTGQPLIGIATPTGANLDLNQRQVSQFWSEGAVTLTNQSVDRNGANGTYTFGDVVTPVSLSGEYFSYLFHFDPAISSGVARVINAVITFPHPIVGISFSQPTLAGTDPIGLYSAVWQTGNAALNRGLDTGDKFTVSGNTVTINLSQTDQTGMDEIRFFTATPEIASLGSWAMLGLAGAYMVRRRRSAA
ncbi:hypothetical protein [Pirellulimonas nuda]|nr:hypothetical protein [Pirellulimonas nuda]